MRTMISLIAFVCDDAALQKKLPQILVVRATSANAREVAQMRAALPPNVSLWIEARAWTTSDVMVRVAKTLHAVERDGKPVIIVSAYPASPYLPCSSASRISPFCRSKMRQWRGRRREPVRRTPGPALRSIQLYSCGRAFVITS